jgi:flagellar basal-body rod modification protein FlgD
VSSVANSLINLQNNTAQVQYNQSQDRIQAGANSQLDNNAFLRLFLTQLQNQDPTNPMDQSQLLQQQASFTQIEQLQNLNSNIESSNQMMQASNLVGKSVTIEDQFGEQSTINVDSVLFDANGDVILRSGEDLYAASQVVEIIANPNTPATGTNAG